ncbi:SapC family protein [Pseudooceanicola nanhaiensis]|uniref:SapC family protein n=1 Tax=Pseudooceanicola nanhaiensis TaxID=375761 RepID=UPI001CD41088|nr:SapC family protein [Pseudooceanicola nanhaiensis]MCA0919581.1 SapC family protein [Pseudooceanicola nanhaiensis]
MTTQLLFYERAVPVTAKAHRDLSIRTGQTYRFAEKVNSVPLTAIEFSAAAAHYPIVFAGTAEKVMPVVILGVKDAENFYVDAEGKWTGGYIPAFVRRYPFVFATDQDSKNFILYVDETFEGCNRNGKGERLFDADGTQTQYLQNILRFLQEYQGQFRRTEAYCKRLMDLELLQPMQAQFNLADGARRSLSGFMAINREKLRKLGDADLRAMFDTDELECTFLHLHSMRHFNDMLGKLASPAAEAPDTAPEVASDEPVPETEEA